MRLIKATICIAAAALLCGCSSSNSADSAAEKAVLDNIATRTSIRSYSVRPVEDKTIETLLKAGMAAPTAQNSQPWVFYVVKDKELMREIANELPFTRMAADAAVLIVPCGDRDKFLSGEGMTYWVQDVSAATENILLAAHAMGLGAVWTGVYPIRERIADVSRILDLDEKHVPLCVIPIGYPAENPKPKDKWDPDKIFWR